MNNMPRKVLISFLGTGRFKDKSSRIYEKTKYKINEEELGEYPFVSAALKKHYNTDIILLLGTPHSMWEEVYRWYCENKGIPVDDDVYLNIAEACEKANHQSDLAIPNQDRIEESLGKDSKVVLIKYGINETEIQDNINIILGLQQYLQQNDELIVDITHSFRSLPIFMMNLLIYLKNVSNKNINISHIHYGMLEVTGEIGYTPIIDLRSMLDVNDWITGAYSFSEFGNAYKISELLSNDYLSTSNLLKEFSDLMNLNHLFAMESISQRLTSFKNQNYKTLLPELIVNPIVDGFVSKFDTKGNRHALFQLKVARWMFDHRKYAQSMITLNEAILTYVCEKNGFRWNDKDDRDTAKKTLRSYKLGQQLKIDKTLSSTFRTISLLRNSTAHALEAEMNVSNMLNTLKNSLIKVESIIK